MLLKIEIDAEEAIDMLDGVAAVVTSDSFADAAGAFALDRILERTLSGKDVDDMAFAPYSSEYARKKGGPVDLYDSGEMLRSLKYQVDSPTQATITCSSEIAKYHEDGTDKMPQRKFVGLSERDTGDMMEKIFTDPLTNLIG